LASLPGESNRTLFAIGLLQVFNLVFVVSEFMACHQKGISQELALVKMTKVLMSG
jgi:hypothetical protein